MIESTLLIYYLKYNAWGDKSETIKFCTIIHLYETSEILEAKFTYGNSDMSDVEWHSFPLN